MRVGATCLALALATPAVADDFEAAMRREIEVLHAEKKGLEAALERAERDGAAAKRALDAEISALTAELVTLRAKTSGASLPADERTRAIEAEARQLAQLGAQLRSLGGEADPVPAFAAHLARVRSEGGARVEDLEFFDAGGAARRGPVLTLGRVAAIRLDPPGPLLRGRGEVLAAVETRAETARFGALSLLPAILFDPREPVEPERYARRDLAEFMHDGGLLMWPIALLGLIALALALERGLALALAARRYRRFLAGHASVSPPIAALFEERLSPDRLEARTGEALGRERVALLRGVSFLGLVAAVAPLLGLLGTVTGMISTFAVITEHGTGDPRLLSGGISEALLTTQLGLAVAIPALLVNTGLHRAAGATLAILEHALLDRVVEEAPR